ncbi:MAG TPA: glycoside hydrolase family 3 N-terminal domain-containing protein [Balneolaceae bacterium]|nr:glycoside hydrolase family 3 N-terminal domain-containing protein [Balneolaceae bacterium]
MRIIKASITVCILLLGLGQALKAQDKPLYKDYTKSIDIRVKDLVQRMTLKEKVSQMKNSAPAIPRLNVPKYDWWNEGLHGVGRSGTATIFPQAIGLAATFDPDLLHKEATAISDEARAMFNAAVAKGYRQKYGGLTFWSPNINIFRDPRWGRGQETYGEDPYLTSVMGTAFVKGMQGDDPNYLKTATTAKHFAVHSGPEQVRHQFNAVVSKKDLYETYLPPFKALVNAGVETVMCSYNAINGHPACADDYLLNQVLRQKWDFQGHVVSDCGALNDFLKNGHDVSPDSAHAAALALKTGVNLNCGDMYSSLTAAVNQGLISEKEIDQRLKNLLKTRFKLGLFDPPNKNPYSDISTDVINSKAHRALARKAATESIVMLKNDGVLPLKNDLSRYFVTGPLAASVEAMIGNYHGINDNIVTIMEGLAHAVAPGSQIRYVQGELLDRPNVNPIDWSSPNAKVSDVTFAVLGINPLLEGEEGAAIASKHFGDRLDYDIPQNQIDYLKKLTQGNDNPVVAIVTGGSPMNLAKVQELADAVLLAWYPGEEGGNAVADVVFGKTSPAGRLPITFPKSLDQLPDYKDYSMQGRTYRYMDAEPLYPFGFGLSYTTFKYSNIRLGSTSIQPNASTTVQATVKNTGDYASDEVVQFYVKDVKASVRVPNESLKGFQRIHLNPGETTQVSFDITPDMLKLVNEEGERVLEPGDFKIIIGGSVPTQRSKELGASEPVEGTLKVK